MPELPPAISPDQLPRVALITGAGGSIGKAIAQTLAGMGMRVVLVGRDQARLERAAAELGPAAVKAHVIPCDVTDRVQVKGMVETALEQAGTIDVAVCGAGINIPQRSLRALDPADWDRVIATNLTGAFNIVHSILPSMRARGSGLIIQMCSISGMRANTLSGASYSASKFAQAALGICVGREERGRNIRSTVIYAGEVNSSFLDTRPARAGGGDDSRRQTILQPQDIAATVGFLASLPPRAHVPEIVLKPAIDDFS